MDALRQDLRFALRLLLKSRGFTAIAVLSMALGIGVNVTVFGILHGILLRPFPYAEPERVVALSTEHPLVKGHYGSWSYLDYVDLQNESTVFQGVAAHRGGGSMTLAGPEGAEQIEIDAVSADLFPLLGVAPVLGRGFTPMEDRPNGPPVVLLSHGLWQRRFRGDPGILGSEVIAGGKPHRVVGVMPPGFEYPDIRQAWVPLGSRWAQGPRSERNLQVKARLGPGVSLEEAQAEMSTLLRRLEEMHPETNAGWRASIEPLRQKLAPAEVRAPFYILAGAAGCVLLLACVNVSSLLLAQAGGRRKELAIRAALGCSRGRIIRQLLTENVLLALAGGALGVLLSPLGLGAASRALAPIPFWMRFTLDGPVLLFALAASVACGLIFGLVPALQAAGIELRSIFKHGGGGQRRKRYSLRAMLVVGEVALALVLLVGTSLFLRSFVQLRNGGEPRLVSRDLLTLWTTLQGDAYDDARSRAQRTEDIARRLAAIPGIDGVGVGSVPFYETGTRGRIALAGRTFAAGKEPVPLTFGVTAGWFRVLRLPLLGGRAFTEQESGSGAAVAVVNQAFARRFFPGEPAVGKRLRLLDQLPRETAGWMTIVGVSGDLTTNPLQPVEPQIYVPPLYQQLRAIGICIRIQSRTQKAREGIVDRVRKELRASDPGLPLYDVYMMEDVVDQYFAVERAVSEGFAIFGAIALFLAAIGIHGVLACSVSQRVHEMGVRIALGAKRRHMVALVLQRGMALALAGIALGLAGALAATRLVAGQLYGISATDPASFMAIPLLLLAVALAACWAPARRAMDADPVEAIRSK
ncbi:MAG TPA: ABC transporter permease [Thermoanaerobaculia bacterium]|nr:ABC transporter permease [Thermoanaerobaculia bacterium]